MMKQVLHNIFWVTLAIFTLSLVSAVYEETTYDPNVGEAKHIRLDTTDRETIHHILEDGSIIRTKTPGAVESFLIEFTDEFAPYVLYEKTTTAPLPFEEYEADLKERLESVEEKILQIDPQATNYFESNYLVTARGYNLKNTDVEKIRALPGVKTVLRDEEVTAQLAQSVPLINAPEVWKQKDSQGNQITGKGVRIAILDTGVDYTHSDLGGCLGPNCKVVGGYDVINNDNDPMDDNGHGTHVAGTAAANGAVKGVAPDAKILAYKVLDHRGSAKLSQIISGMNMAAQNADVISLSLGGFGYSDDALSNAANNAVTTGTIVVVSAGNSGPTGDRSCNHPNGYEGFSICTPGSAEHVITVGASDKNDRMADFSSRGFALRSNKEVSFLKPDITAPGVAIRAPVPKGNCELCDPSGYLSLRGTSMAAPHVAGVAALIKQANPTHSPAQIKSTLINSAKDLGKISTIQGAGRIQALQAYKHKTAVSPAVITLAINKQADTQTYTTTKDVVLTNTGVVAKTYQLLVSTDNEVTATLSQKSFTLAPKQTTTVKLTVRMDNSKATDKIYTGKITDANSALTIPFSVLKTKTLEIAYNKHLEIRTVLDDKGRLLSISPNTFRSQKFYLPKGIYHVLSKLKGSPSWANTPPTKYKTTIFSKITLDANTPTLHVKKDDARFLHKVTNVDKNGNEFDSELECGRLQFNWLQNCITNSERAIYFNHDAPLTTSGGNWDKTHMYYNAAPNWSTTVSHTYNTPEPGHYEHRDYVHQLIASQHTITKPVLALTMLYNLFPNRQSFERRVEIVGGYGKLWIWFGGYPRNIPLESSGQNYERIYTVPDNPTFAKASEKEKQFGGLFTITSQTDKNTRNYLHFTSFFRVPTQNVLEQVAWSPRYGTDNLRLINDDSTSYKGIHEYDTAPSHWNGRFYNTHNVISVYRNQATPFGRAYFLGRNNVGPPEGIPQRMTYEIYDSSNKLVKRGSSPGGSIFEQVPGYAAYTFKTGTKNQEKIGTKLSSIDYTARFDLNKVDRMPPMIDFFRVVSGKYSYAMPSFPNDQNNKILMGLHDESSANGINTVTLSYALSGTNTWKTLTVTKKKDFYETTLPSLQDGYYKTKLEASDNSGNSFEQITDPTFEINGRAQPPKIQHRPPVCGNTIREPGEECGEPGMKTCPFGSKCQSCKCVAGCVTPTTGLRVSDRATIKFCPGTYNVHDIDLGRNSVIDCNDAHFIGDGSKDLFKINNENVVLKNCHIENYATGLAVGLWEDKASTITNNVFKNNKQTAIAYRSNDKKIGNHHVTGNIFIDNKRDGLLTGNSNGITATTNTFINNQWDVTGNSLTLSKNIPVGGNYWSKYQGTDTNKDSYGDTPFQPQSHASQVKDNHPLMNPRLVWADEKTKIREPFNIHIASPNDAGKHYLIVMSFGKGAFPIGNRNLYLDPRDPLFQTSVSNPNNPYFKNMYGKLDAQGRAKATVTLPDNPTWAGTKLHFAGVVFDANSQHGIKYVTHDVPVTLEY